MAAGRIRVVWCDAGRIVDCLVTGICIQAAQYPATIDVMKKLVLITTLAVPIAFADKLHVGATHAT